MSELRILLVDDDDNDLELFLRALEMLEHDVAVTTARDGIEALELLEKQAGDLPQLLLVDYKMPRMDGIHFLEVLRKDPALCTIPAVLLTSSQDRMDVSRAYAAGANAYLVKPVNFCEFKRMVEVLVNFWLELNQVPYTQVRPAPR